MKMLVAVVLACVWVGALAASGVIQGTVFDAAMQRVTNGSIEMTVNGTPAGSTPIDGNGAFNTLVIWPGNAPASCDLRSIVAGFIDQTINVQLQSGGSVSVQFTLLLDDTIFADGFEPSPGN